MAYDKVVDSVKLDADMTIVADAIRARAGTSEPLAFPEGMKEAVEGINDESASVLMAVLDRSIEEIANDSLTLLGSSAFSGCTKLWKVSLPSLTETKGAPFSGCSALVDTYLPSLRTVGNNTFQSCSKMSMLKLPSCKQIGGSVFKGCSALTALVLSNASTICYLVSTNTFENSPIASGTGYIYVPKALLSDTDASKDYRRATNWSAYKNQFRAIEDYPEITGD